MKQIIHSNNVEQLRSMKQASISVSPKEYHMKEKDLADFKKTLEKGTVREALKVLATKTQRKLNEGILAVYFENMVWNTIRRKATELLYEKELNENEKTKILLDYLKGDSLDVYALGETIGKGDKRINMGVETVVKDINKYLSTYSVTQPMNELPNDFENYFKDMMKKPTPDLPMSPACQDVFNQEPPTPSKSLKMSYANHWYSLYASIGVYKSSLFFF